MKKVIILFFIVFQLTTYSQNVVDSKFGSIYKFEFKNSPFPSKLRINGHSYDKKFYSAEEHYQDSTVLIFIPNYFILNDSVDYVFYFHGWNNNIDSALSQFNLIEQFYNSKKNAIFVFPEGPKNSPDSFGGKLEEKNRFHDLVGEINVKLEEIFKSLIKVGNITLAGHSGAYRVIANIILNGGLTDKIKNVILFDALYADTEKFAYWLDHYKGKFIDIYTEHGGTKSESENLMNCLVGWGIPYTLINSDDFTSDQLKNNKIVFISSSLEHNEVIRTKNQFCKFLQFTD
jgi:hypothetical protein